MYSYDRTGADYRALYARLFQAMSMEEAKEALGFPPGYDPSPSEIQKAYRSQAIKNHPDRGGDHRKMVEINVAKEILEGKRQQDRTEFKPREKSPDEIRREELIRKRNIALGAIGRAEKAVGNAFEACRAAADITSNRINLLEFLAKDLDEAIDKIQDSIDDSPQKGHPDMRKADTLCQSISNKAKRLGKKFLGILKIQGEHATVALRMTGSESVTVASLTKDFGEITKFIAAFSTLYEESRRLTGLIRTSEALPIEWDDVYGQLHEIIDSFKADFERFSDESVQRYRRTLGESLRKVDDAMLAAVPDQWKSKDADVWRYPEDFDEATDLLNKAASKSASYDYRRA